MITSAAISKSKAMKNFRCIPGVGKTIAEDFWNLGLRKVADLKRQNPQKLYERLCKFQKSKGDRCMLYVMRCAVYFASTKKPKSDLLKWWNWKDK
jgi:Pathogenicity locus